MPDTSPRGDNVADDTIWESAGFYLNATQAPWSAHSACTITFATSCPQLIAREFNLSGRAISGHSMAATALVMALKNPGRFVSVSRVRAYRTDPGSWGKKSVYRLSGSG